MLTQERVDELLHLQRKAYEILMWFADEATKDPYLLGPQAVAHLGRASTAAAWIEIHASKFRTDQLTPSQLRASSALFSSLFATSFRVQHLYLDNKLLETRLKVGLGPDTPEPLGFEHSQVLALRHLARSEKSPISEQDARRLVQRISLRQASLLWTYAWELDRRALSKGKGPIVHKIWRPLSHENRKALNTELIWTARHQLLDAIGKLSEVPTYDGLNSDVDEPT